MIRIQDYRNLPVPRAPDRPQDFAAIMGQTVSVRTAAGAYTGVAVLEDDYSLTLAYSKTVRGRRQNRQCVISKAHIIAVESLLT